MKNLNIDLSKLSPACKKQVIEAVKTALFNGITTAESIEISAVTDKDMKLADEYKAFAAAAREQFAIVCKL